MTGKYIANVETLRQAMAREFGTNNGAPVVLFDALPTPPLAEDVQAAVVECESAYCISLDAGVVECPELCRCKADQIIIAALHAATELARQYREDYEASVAAGAEVRRQITERDATIAKLRAAVQRALDAVLADTEHDGITCTACGEGPEVHDDTCPFAPLAAALADTPPADVVVVPQADPEAQAVAELLAMERAGRFVALDYTDRRWFVHMRRRPGGGDFVDRTTSAVELLAEVKTVLKEATDA